MANEELYRELGTALRPPRSKKPTGGSLGYVIGGEFLIEVPNKPARYYVRTNSGFVEALHLGRVAPIANFPVELEEVEGDLAIKTPDLKTFETYSGQYGGDVSSKGYIRSRSGVDEYEIDDRSFAKLAVRVVSGMLVIIQYGVYVYQGQLKVWDNPTPLDLAPYRPVISGRHTWAVIGIDPVGNDYAIAVDPNSQTTAIPLARWQIPYVPFDWDTNIFLCAIRLANGQTALVEGDFEALLSPGRTSEFGTAFDADAIHGNTAGEISILTEKATPVVGDWLLSESAADGNAKRKIQIGNLPFLTDPTDPDAIHVNVTGEISGLTEKLSPVAGDWLVLESVADGNAKRKVQAGNLPAGLGEDPDAIHVNVTGEINALTEKTTPSSADIIIIESSPDGFAKRKVQIGNLPSGGGGNGIDALQAVLYARVFG